MAGIYHETPRNYLAAAGPKAIPGTAKRGGEPAYRKPKLPEKAVIADYYRRIAAHLLRHAAHRPLKLFRCTAGFCFFQRNRNHPESGAAFASPVHFVPIGQKNGRTEDYLWVEDEPGVSACAAADAIEFHGWGSLAGDVERPDRVVFDLDPGEGIGFTDVKAAASTMRDLLEAVGLRSYPLLSGGKEVHVVVLVEPVEAWDEVREFTRRLCTALAGAEPARFTVSLPKAQRKGRIFLDFLRNQRTATAILPWSVRARPSAPVAAPVTWEELADLSHAGIFTIADLDLLLRRAGSKALRGWGEGAQRLPRLA